MKQSLERELKYLVNREIFEKAIDKVRKMSMPVEALTQINYFYDTNNQIWNQQDVTIRVRKIKNRYYLQTKQRTQKEEQRLETEMQIDSLPKHIQLTDGFVEEVNDYNQLVKIQGALLTKRTSFFYQNNVRLDFDKNYYLGQMDYEIEIEFQETMCEDIRALALELLGTDVKNKVIGKRIRFFNALNSIRRSTDENK